LPAEGEGGGQVQRGGGFPHAAFLIGNGDNFHRARADSSGMDTSDPAAEWQTKPQAEAGK
jgi:hypothetical protein